jgi:hypothetical protein
MAIVKITSYTKNKEAAKKTVRYLAHRPDKNGGRTTRELFGPDGELSKEQAYRLINSARKGATFFRIAISPDPTREDTYRDLYLSDITIETMAKLEERKKQEIAYLVSEHNDHAPHRHSHVLALLNGRLDPNDLRFLRETATHASQVQRQERDLAREAREREARAREEAQWAI